MRGAAIVRLVLLLPVAVAGIAASAAGRQGRADPSIGYVYPAGGQRGAVIEIHAGGQGLRGVSAAYVSGEGVQAKVLRHVRPLRPEQIQELRRQLTEIADARQVAPGKGKGKEARTDPKGRGDAKKADANRERVELPDHPLLRDLETKSADELRQVAARFLGAGNKRQVNAQIAETVDIEVTIEPGAAPGDRELRLATPAGMTNPLRFQVGALPEAREVEPLRAEEGDAAVLDVPVLLNGQILPGDVDRFRLRARRGQHLVVDASARRLIPYLADAVPGWFQATATLYDAKGNEVAFADDYRFEPDPVLFLDVPADGEYVLEIRDALYRGREDFVYRVAVGEVPFITRMFPLGVSAGLAATVAIAGWNLPGAKLVLDARTGTDQVRWTAAQRGKWLSNRVPFAVDGLAECEETEPNDDARRAQRLALPRIVNGRVGKSGDVDVFAFDGHAGEEVVAEVEGRRLSSPLDSVLSLVDASGSVLAWNDDYEHGDAGLVTHAADSYLRARLPADGAFLVRLRDAQNHGGQEYAYRLRIGPPRPGFDVFVAPSGLSVPAGRTTSFRVRAVRSDGFDGAIELRLMDAPAGFVLGGGRIPPGCTNTRMTLTAPGEPLEQPVILRLEASAQVDGAEVSRPIVPADERMQAFLLRHLVPAQQLMVAVTGAGRGAPPVEISGGDPVRIPVGSTATVRFKSPRRGLPGGIRLELVEPPPGLTIESVLTEREGLALVLKADAATAKAGTAGNLIVEVITTAAGGQRGAGDKAGPKGAAQDQRRSLGVLPAIAFEIVGSPSSAAPEAH